MTTDINGTVVGIQGNAVQSGTLTSADDGYVLTWDNADNQWEAKPSVGLQSQTFTSNGTWTCPNNVFNVWLSGFGGGGGGGGGVGNTASAQGAGGGGGSLRVNNIVPVVPGTIYTISIGAGGSAGTGNKAVFEGGGNGFSTTFGSLYTAPGGGGFNGGNSGGYNNDNYLIGAPAISFAGWFSVSQTDPTVSPCGPGSGGYGTAAPTGNIGSAGHQNEAYTGGSSGSCSTNGGSGGGGGAGPGGNGATGGNGGSSPTNGSSAAANSGAGGGGGGGSTSNVNGGNGGAGGSGQLQISWIA